VEKAISLALITGLANLFPPHSYPWIIWMCRRCHILDKVKGTCQRWKYNSIPRTSLQGIKPSSDSENDVCLQLKTKN